MQASGKVTRPSVRNDLARAHLATKYPEERMDALSSWVTRHRTTVGLLWLAITVVGIVLAPSVSSRLKSGNHLHSAAYTADQQIATQYGGATSNPGVFVLDLPAGQTVTSPGVA